jgi:hypothetical protein
MSRADVNLASYANEEGIDLVGNGLLDGQKFDDALKLSNCRGVTVREYEILGGREDCIDINRGKLINVRDCSLHPKGRYAMTIKGGAECVIVENVTIFGRGSEVDIDLGNWSDQCGEKTTGVVLRNVRGNTSEPVRVRVLHAGLPLVDGGNVRVLDRRWMAWFYRLGKRWGAISCLAATLVLAGCASTGSNVKAWNPFTWFSGSEARTQARAVARVDSKREAVLKAAQMAGHETAAALAAAPASRPVEVATESANTVSALMDQALGAPTVGELAALRSRVTALLSENEQIRIAAEKDRSASRANAAELSRDLAAANAAKAKAETNLADAFARENALANKYRNMVFAAWALAGLSAVLGLAWLYLKFAAGGLPGAIGKALAFADTKHPEQAEFFRTLLDTHLNRSEQSSIAGQVAKAALRMKSA